MRMPYATLLVLVFLGGCCPPEEDLTNRFHQTLLENPIMQFVDSNGNELLLVYAGREQHDVSGQGTGENRTMHCEASAFMQRARFICSPDNRFGFDEHTYGLLLFNGKQSEYVYYNATDTVEIRNHTYTACAVRYSDTTNVSLEFVFDYEYGIVLMAEENEYRWERVLNP